jgi:hypothetical protein
MNKTKNIRKSKKNTTRYSRRNFTKKQIGCCGCSSNINTKSFFNGGKSSRKSMKKSKYLFNRRMYKKQKGGSTMDFARDYNGNFLNAQDPLNVRNLVDAYKFNNIDLANQPIVHPEKYMNPMV